MSKGNPFLALRLTHDQQDALRAKAAESGFSASELVRQVNADYLAGRRQVALRHRAPSPLAPLPLVWSAEEGLPLPGPPLDCPWGTPPQSISPGSAATSHRRSRTPAGRLRSLARSPAGLLQDTTTAELLTEAIDSLQEAVDLLNATVPPRGFGRD